MHIYLLTVRYTISYTETFGLSTAKLVFIPMNPGTNFHKDQGLVLLAESMWICKVLYAEAIEMVLWEVMMSRPDVAFATRVLAQLIQNPAEMHWCVIKQVMIYLRDTRDH